MANKRLSATVTIGGALDGSFRGATDQAKARLSKIGDAVASITARQKELRRVIKEEEGKGAAGSALRVDYANQELAQLDKKLERLKVIRQQAVSNGEAEKRRVGEAIALERQLDAQRKASAAAHLAASRRQEALDKRIGAAVAKMEQRRLEYAQRFARAQEANSAKRAEYRGQVFDTVAIGAAAAAPIKIAADRESHAMGIAKQMQGARDDAGNLTKEFWDMRKQVVGLGSEIPMATNDLLDLATAGLRMGVAKDEILGFTTNVAKLASALELPAEEVGDQFGKIKNVYKLSLDQLKRLGDAVNYLDDQNTVKGGELIDFLQRVGGSAGMAKVTAQEMAGIGTALISMGESADTAATSVRALFTKMAAGSSGTKKAKAAMLGMGLNPEAVAKGMQKNALGTIEVLMQRINKLAPEKRTGVITDIFGLEHVGQISKLATSTKQVREAVDQANDAYAKGTSVQKEFNNTVGTTNSKFQILKNQTGDVADNIGTVLLPAVNDVMGALGKGTRVLADFAEQHPALTKVVAGTVVGLVSLKATSLLAKYAFTFLKGGALQVAGALAGARGQMVLTTAGARTMTSAMGMASGGLVGMATRALPAVATGIRLVGMALVTTPVGAVIAGIAAAVYLLWRNWDLVKAAAVGFGRGVMESVQPVLDTFHELYESLGPLKPVADAVGETITKGFKLAGEAVGVVWDWFTKLLNPVQHSSEELAKAQSAGESFGRVVGGALELSLKPLKLLISGIKWITENGANALSLVGQAVDTARSKLPTWAGGLDVKDGETTPQAKIRSGEVALPAVPAIAGSKRGGAGYTDQSETKIYVTQQPGQNARQLAEEVTRIQEEKKAARQRAVMHDGGT